MLKAKFEGKGKNTVVTEFSKVEGRIRKSMEEEATYQIKAATKYFTQRLLAYTPVHTGKTIRNFRWQQGRPYSGPVLEPLGVGKVPKSSIDVPLGSEARRPANEADVWVAWGALNFREKVYITNKWWVADALDNGTIKARSIGMMRRAIQDLKVHAISLGKRRVK